MKRKIKVFSAIASLCLAVALMAFGVYAATQVTYTLSGSVTYTTNDVLVDISGRVEKAQSTKYGFAANGDADNEANTNYGDIAGWDNAQTLTGYQSYDPNTFLPKVPGETDAQTESVNVNLGESSAWKITVTVTNQATSSAVKVDLEDTSNDENFHVIIEEGTTQTTGATKGAAVTFTIYILLDDPTTSISAGTYSFKFTCTRAA